MGFGTALNTTDGQRDTAFPKVNGRIQAAVPDGSGGWYIAGDFTKVGSSFRLRLARVLYTGKVASWDPQVEPAQVNALALSPDGKRLFVGGAFTTVGGTSRNRLAAVDTTTGTVDPNWNPNAGGTVNTLAVSGGKVYAGGAFTSIGGATRNRLAAVDATTGTVDPNWNPNAGGTVNTLAVSGGKVYAGGTFTTVGGTSRNRLAAVDATSGAVDSSWNPNAGGTINTLAVSGGKVYAGGAFTTVGGTSRNRLAAVDATSGALDSSWNPNAGGTINTLAVSGGKVYAGGTFTSVGGTTRNNLAVVAATSGAVDASWNPNANGAVSALAVTDSSVYAGGTFTSVGGVTRNRLAAVDASTGAVDPSWNPNANFSVRAMVPSQDGQRIYLGGDFTDLSDTLRSRLAAVDASTGAVDKTFNAGTVNSTVRALAVAGNRLYLGGDFTSVKSQSRTRLAAVDATTGALDSNWTPTADATVRVLRLSRDGGRVYAGGAFNTVSGQARSYLVALNPLTGALNETWLPPKPNGTVFSLEESGGRVYTAAGGGGGAVEAFNSTTGARAWSKTGDGDVQALLVRGDKVYAGGHFDRMDGQVRRRLVALDMATGAVDPQWVPEIVPRADGTGLPDSGVWTMAGASGPRLYIGGDFQKITRLVQAGYAQFSDTDTAAPTVAATTPEDGAEEVALATDVVATFSKAMDESSLNDTVFTLTEQVSATAVAASVSYDPVSKTATLNPSSDLDANATYTVTLEGGASGARDVVGNALAADKVWSFATPDDTAPETTIESGPSGTVGSTSATLSFSSSETGSSFECGLDGAPSVVFSSCSSPKDYTDLSDGSHTFQVRATDAAGNVDSTPATLTWTVDATAPTVGDVTPQDAATDVALGAGVEATFSKQMDASTIDGTTFTLTGQGDPTPVAATVGYDAATNRATLTPDAELAPSTTYTATLKGGAGGVKDRAGNALAQEKVWSFSTVAPADTTPPAPPTGLDLLPSSDTGTSDTDNVTADNSPTFSADAEPGSTVRIYGDASAPPLGSAPADASGVATVTSEQLADATYTISATATDDAGNVSASSTTINVTVGVAVDTTPPTVGDVTPQDAATDVALGAGVEATFSKQMDASTIDGTTFTLTGQGDPTPVAATVGYDAATNRATLTPDAELAPSTTYTATLKGGAGGVKDRAGNALAQEKVWSFSTVAPADTTPPTVTIDSGPSWTVSTDSATFAFSSEAGAILECSLDGASFSTCASPKNYTSLPDGSHTFGVKATDNTGNVSQTVSRTWTVDAEAVLMAAGDISCGPAGRVTSNSCQQLAVSNLLVDQAPDAVATLGDNQYECGSLADYASYYGPSWGRVKAITRPAIGNHEYQTSTSPTDLCYNAPSGAPGYFQYFGNAASPTEPGCIVNCKGYYSYDLGTWHIIVLNSNCAQVGGCSANSPQGTWLKQDLAAHATSCTAAYWHYPRYSSGGAGTTFHNNTKTFWQLLYNARVEAVLNASDHIYERFAPMNPNGALDRANGIRQFVVGTGGKSHHGIASIQPNSEVRNADTFGALKMTLRPDGYDWKFEPVAGSTFTDSGSESCH